jgi:hypothetical protein
VYRAGPAGTGDGSADGPGARVEVDLWDPRGTGGLSRSCGPVLRHPMRQDRQSLRDHPPSRTETLGYLTDSHQSDVEISEEFRVDGLLPIENSRLLPAALQLWCSSNGCGARSQSTSAASPV